MNRWRDKPGIRMIHLIADYMNGVVALLFPDMTKNTHVGATGVMPMVDYLILLLQKMFDAFLTTLASKLAERLAASKDAKTKSPVPAPPKAKGMRPEQC